MLNVRFASKTMLVRTPIKSSNTSSLLKNWNSNYQFDHQMATIKGHFICQNDLRRKSQIGNFPRIFPKISQLWRQTILLKQCFLNSLIDGVYEPIITILILRLDVPSNNDIFMPKKFLRANTFCKIKLYPKFQRRKKYKKRHLAKFSEIFNFRYFRLEYHL